MNCIRLEKQRSVAVLVAKLKECSSSKDLKSGRIIHGEAERSGYEQNIYVANTLVSMYSKCGSMVEAHDVLKKIPQPDVVSFNAMILGYAENSQAQTGLDLFHRMPCAPNSLTFLAALKACAALAVKEETGLMDGKVVVKLKSLECTMKLHVQAAKTGLDSEVFVANTLVNTYFHCGNLVDARTVFDRMRFHSVVSWSVLILGYVESSEAELALMLFSCMREKGCQPSAQIFVAAVKACTCLACMEEGQMVGEKMVKLDSLRTGKMIHLLAANAGCDSDVFVTSSLIDFYSRCGCFKEASKVYEELPHRCVVSRTAMMLGCADHGCGELALEIFSSMRSEGCEPDSRAYVAALKGCIALAAKEEGVVIEEKVVKLQSLEKGMAVHSDASKHGFDEDIFVASSVVDMYSKCGSMSDARRVFLRRMPHHSVVSWTSLMLGYVESEEEEVALELLQSMIKAGCSPNALSFVAALKACTGLAAKEEGGLMDEKMVALEKGMKVDATARRMGLETEIFVANSLMEMYGSCGSMIDARWIFDKMKHRTVISWNVLMRGYAENGEAEMTLELFSLLPREGCVPNVLSFAAVLKACTSLAAKEAGTEVGGRLLKLVSLEKTRSFHLQVLENGYHSDVSLMNSVVDSYAKCGSLVDAERTFSSMSNRNVVSWNTLILAFADNGEGEAALQLFSNMTREGLSPNARTYFAALKACVALAGEEVGRQVGGKVVKVDSLKKGEALHLQASENGFDSNAFVRNSLVEMYAKCGSLTRAREVFDKFSSRSSVVAWTALMLGYAESGEAEETLKLFQSMNTEGSPNSLAFVAALKACTALSQKHEGENLAGNKVVKVKSLESGMSIHSRIEKTPCNVNLMVMNSLLDMYTNCGSMTDARQVFDRMRDHSLVSWNTLILGYAENCEAELALELFLHLRHVEEVDAWTLVSALRACSISVAVEVGRAIHADAHRLGLEDNVVLESSLLDFYGKCGWMVSAQLLFDMVSRRDLVTWNALLAGYARQGKAEVVLLLMERMFEEGLRPDGISFVAVLTACSHAGLFEKGKRCFRLMKTRYGVAAGVEHYHCMVDILGRANELEGAVRLVEEMPFKANAVTWGTVLAACRMWKNVDVGRVAFDNLLALDDADAAAYVVMANIYQSVGLPEEQARVEAAARGRKLHLQENS